MKRILIIEVNWVGDVLFSTPFIRAVKGACPDSHIACLVHPRCKEILEYNPCVDEIILYDEEKTHRGILGKIKLIFLLRGKNFDTAFILHRSFTKALIAYLSGIKERIGYIAKKGRAPILTKGVPEPYPAKHKVEYFLDLARAVGISPGPVSYEFVVTEGDRDFVRSLISGDGIAPHDKVVVVNPGGNWGPKRWPKESFAKLADLLAQKFGVKIVISGAEKDKALAEDIKRLMKSKAVVVAGKISLRQLGALLQRASLVVSNDSGPMHMAVAVGAKVIAIFGPTSPGLTGPYGAGDYTVIFKEKECEVPCYDKDCKYNSCMSDISVDEVMSAASVKLA
ncbi:MAG: lipopolysaccharide heptosyltransferase II [Candidatus Omnitrophica bacterium]|nr:lipopolysaccharide heptosyltransferase II [Candidatus Omnitrophota bacterium]